ncbi:MAG: Transcription termination factor Rho [Planctomycetota bacterium]
MPTSRSDSEGTSQRPRRRAAARTESADEPQTSPRRRRTAESSAPSTPAPEASDDFGSGLDTEPAPAREARPPRRTRRSTTASAAPDVTPPPAEPETTWPTDTPEAPARPARRSRLDRGSRRTPASHSTADADSDGASAASSRSDESENRTSNRLERKLADVEAETGMRYFSTDDLDFGDDEPAPKETSDRRPPRRDRGPRRDRRQRDDFGSQDRAPAADHVAETESSSRYQSERDDFADWGDQLFGGDSAGDEVVRDESSPGAPVEGEPGDGEGRRRRRRRRRRRGGDRPGGDAGPRFEQRGDQGPPRFDGPPGRREFGRFEGGRSRRGGRNRRGGDNRGGQPMGSRGPGFGRDYGPGPGPQARKPTYGATPAPVIEGTFEGVLEVHHRGYGFLRDPKRNYVADDANPFVSTALMEKYGLREGVLIRAQVGSGSHHHGPRVHEVELIDGMTPGEYSKIRLFDDLTAINPFEQIKLETGPKPLTMRVMDLLCPIGKGQRALLVAPPRTGKTMLLQDIAHAVSVNHPEIHLMVLLIDERPEEVTEMRRLVKGEVISSSLDNDVESHIRLATLIIERAKRLAEEGRDVFILLDSITRLARAFNKHSNTGRTGTGGLDIRALDIPKKLFGQARRFEEGGSLTVCGTALIDTGSRMDEAIFQEFKGTGNMEMMLSRDLADRRIWPSIDITRSGTRREEKILPADLLDGITMLRRSLISLNPIEAMEQLTRTMERFPTNREFLTRIRAVL